MIGTRFRVEGGRVVWFRSNEGFIFSEDKRQIKISITGWPAPQPDEKPDDVVIDFIFGNGATERLEINKSLVKIDEFTVLDKAEVMGPYLTLSFNFKFTDDVTIEITPLGSPSDEELGIEDGRIPGGFTPTSPTKH